MGGLDPPLCHEALSNSETKEPQIFEVTFTAGRQIYILLLTTKAFLVRVCALDLLLTKIGIFISKTNPLEVDEKITLRCIVYLHFSELLFMDL